MSDKIEPRESVKALKIGAKDTQGNTIIQVLSAGDEYAIYEIDKQDLSERLRVLIDCYTNEHERELAERFAKVKQKYIEAKGLLYRSANLGMMKSRVAHVLSAVLASDKVDGNKEFEELIHKINDEYRQVAVSRLFYLLPTILFTIAISMQAFYLVWSEQYGEPLWSVTCVLLGSCLGGSLSIFYGLKKYRFEEYSKSAFYLMFGMERVLLAFIAGAVAYVIVKSGVIDLGTITHFKNKWDVIFVSVVAGFSESLVPSVIEKVSENVTEKKTK